MQELDASFRAEGSKFRRRRDGAMSVSGHSRRFERAAATSALAPKPDILLRRGEWSEGQSPFNQQGKRELLPYALKINNPRVAE